MSLRLPERVARFSIRRRLKRILALRMIKKEDAKILRAAEEDATIDTDVEVPTSLEDALPSDKKLRDTDQRAIVVTEMTGSFNMIGCNKAWENLCGYAECEIRGKDSSILQTEDTNYLGLREAVQRLFEEEAPQRVVSTNKRKDGSSEFRCWHFDLKFLVEWRDLQMLSYSHPVSLCTTLHRVQEPHENGADL